MKYKPAADNCPFDKIAIQGIDDEGIRYVRVKAYRKSATNLISRPIPLKDFRGKGGAASNKLAEDGIVLFDSFPELLDQVVDLDTFQERRIARCLGWHGEAFVCADGSFIKTASEREPIVCLPRQTALPGSSGDHGEWVAQVANTFSGHPRAQFVMMLPFVGPLLRFANPPFNFGIELSGGPATGKTTLLLASASSFGPVHGAQAETVMSMNATNNAVDDRMQLNRDHPLFLEEWANLMLKAGSNSGRVSADLIFSLAGGKPRARHRSESKPHCRNVWLTTTNQPWRENSEGVDIDIARAASDRMMTLEVNGKGYVGLFSRNEMNDSSLSDLCGQLSRATATHYGTAVEVFLQRLCQLLEDEGQAHVSGYVDRKMKHFQTKVEEREEEFDDRVVANVALIYAAGEMAKNAGALPASYKPFKAAMSALRRICWSRNQIVTPVSMLLRLSESKKVLDLRKGLDATRQEIDEAVCILKCNDGHEELLLTHSQMTRLPLRQSAVVGDRAVRMSMVTEEGRLQVYRTLYPGRRERVFCFRLKELRPRQPNI